MGIWDGQELKRRGVLPGQIKVAMEFFEVHALEWKTKRGANTAEEAKAQPKSQLRMSSYHNYA